MKNFEVNFSPVALDDVEETKAYYEKLQAGLGKRFSTQLQTTLNSIGKILSLHLFDMMTSAVPE